MEDKMTVILYKVTCTKGYMMGEQGEGYSLGPWGSNTPYYEGHNDGGKEYTLPEGITVGIGHDDKKHLYDSSGNCIEFGVHKHTGKPQLYIDMGSMPVLEPVA